MSTEGDGDDWIPCEICDTVVRFHDYESHMQRCIHTSTPFFVARFVHPNSGNRGDESETDDGDDDESIHDEPGNAEGRNAEGRNAESYPDDRALMGDVLRIRVVGGAAQWLQAFETAVTANGPFALNDYELNTMIADMVGRVQNGVSDIDSVIVSVSDVTAAYTSDDKCPICYESLLELASNGKNVVHTTDCKHSFCDDCIRNWLSVNTTCPVCMNNLADAAANAAANAAAPL